MWPTAAHVIHSVVYVTVCVHVEHVSELMAKLIEMYLGEGRNHVLHKWVHTGAIW